MQGLLGWTARVLDARRRCQWCGRELPSARSRVRGRRACSVEHALALEDWWTPGSG